MSNLIPVERMENKIYLIRGQKVMLDRDLAELYKVSTRDLNKAVTRNLYRFPEDFMFQLNKSEFVNLKFHFGTSRLPAGKAGWGGTRKLPRVFTEQGIAMLSSVLRSKRAVLVNIAIMRAFVRIGQILSTHKELLRKLDELEKKTDKNTADIQLIFKVIRKMLEPEPKTEKKIGFLK
ncbi:MAG: ORF6N domain-containing protein [Candidatus Saganbacteria bacterium]|nr:ORF6N domain-containing protein [Candidatus Saganbacteria bacterium]